MYNLSNIDPTKITVKKTTEELIKEYCAAIDGRLIWVLGIAMFMWIIEPAVRLGIIRALEQKPELKQYMTVKGFMMIYRYLGVGLLMIVGVGIYII